MISESERVDAGDEISGASGETLDNDSGSVGALGLAGGKTVKTGTIQLHPSQ